MSRAASPWARPLRSTWEPRDDRGPVLHVALVGCGKAKAKEARRARELYTGSLFRAGLAHAIATADEVRIVSAKHFVVAVDDELEPYDLNLADLSSAKARKGWGESVVHALAGAFPDRELHVTLWMGGAYSDELLPALNKERIAWERPLDGMTLGQRLGWFAAESRQREERKADARAAASRAAVLAAKPLQLALPAPWAGPRQLALFG